jgi:NAD(P)-dependent dehydrogenase (short-subunit alcohol dehydrogenase family)
MGVYAVTGSASGMGRQAADKLRAAGHTVIGVDLRDADVVADLSGPDGRATAAREVLTLCGGRLDGAVLAAGVGPTPRATQLILQVNYFGVVDLLEAWRSALAAPGRAKVVVVASNSTTTVPAVPRAAVRALLAGHVTKAVRRLRLFGPGAPSLAYAASKIAVTRWVRRQAVEPSWAGAGIRLNALAPGAIMTPLLEKQLATPGQEKAVRSFPVPVGGFGDPAQLADWMLFMLSDAADFLCGSVVFVDGGTDAYFRADDWPRAVPARRALGYLLRMRSFSKTGSRPRHRDRHRSALA